MYSKVFRALKLCVTLTIQIMAIITKIRETVPLPGGRYGHWNQIEPDLQPDSPLRL